MKKKNIHTCILWFEQRAPCFHSFDIPGTWDRNSKKSLKLVLSIRDPFPLFLHLQKQDGGNLGLRMKLVLHVYSKLIITCMNARLKPFMGLCCILTPLHYTSWLIFTVCEAEGIWNFTSAGTTLYFSCPENTVTITRTCYPSGVWEPQFVDDSLCIPFSSINIVSPHAVDLH